MEIFNNIIQLQDFLGSLKDINSIGFVPTMGSLHTGHLSLIEASKKENDITICSVFVNKIQFNNEADFIKYPRNEEQDIELLKAAECDVVFIPTQEALFPENYCYENFNLGEIENVLEGLYRPGHFQGVCNVVHRFIDIIQPNKLYLGLKDLQQCKVIEKMIQLKNYKPSLEIVLCETSRNSSGLALSSRNKRLSKNALNHAVILIDTLKFAKNQILNSTFDLSSLYKKSIDSILKNGFESVDYFEFVDEDFEIITNHSQVPKYILTAATIEDVRLIDNIII